MTRKSGLPMKFQFTNRGYWFSQTPMQTKTKKLVVYLIKDRKLNFSNEIVVSNNAGEKSPREREELL